MDALSSAVITGGGFAVVAAVLGIFVYLIAVVVPLFTPGRADPRLNGRSPVSNGQLWVRADEHATSALMLAPDGLMRVLELDTGQIVSEQRVIAEGRSITAWSRAPREGYVAFGYDDGSIQIGRLTFETSFLFDEASVAALSSLEPGQTRIFEGGVVQRTVLGQFRKTDPLIDLAQPAALPLGFGAVRLIDYLHGSESDFVAAIRDDGTAMLERVRKITPLGGGAPRVSLTSYPVPFAPPAAPGVAPLPGWIFVTGDGGSLLALWPGGLCQRYSTSDPEAIVLAETTRLVPEGATITAAQMMVGSSTLAIGDDAGGVSGWFVARDAATQNRDKLRLVQGHDHGSGGADGKAAIVDIGVSERDRNFLTADASGELALRNMTSHKVVARADAGDLGAITDALILPKGDGLMAFGQDGAYRIWSLDPGHPEATAGSLFGRVWYEGEPEPAHVYQSSSGDDAAEAKLGLTPLIYGTVKATIYTLLFAVPMAVLAAICTSEFMHRRVRAYIKPTIEVMASLPSVVLGFIAAMLLAPLIVEHLPGILIAFAVIPIGVMLAAYLWQLVPATIARGSGTLVRGGLIVLVTLASAWASIHLGPVIESWLFRPSEQEVLVLAGSYEAVPGEARPDWIGARTDLTSEQRRRLRREGLYFRDGAVVRPVGSVRDAAVQGAIVTGRLAKADLRSWLNGTFGGAWPGWFLVAFPAAGVFVVFGMSRTMNSWSRSLGFGQTPLGAGLVELARFVVSIAAAATVAAGLASFLTSLGLDPRDSIFGTFQQRNTLVVALAMAVAVIPIIYTVSEDAMTSVPDSLRSASLAAGATRWQTAIRVVLPVAMSGVFSATMIGLGRAAGETMIVLMATGNTPIMSASLFDGMRTLSANIAVELPEAPKDSTHYRVLFLCGLALFIMTFVVNTVAEIIRQRFRKRSAQL